MYVHILFGQRMRMVLGEMSMIDQIVAGFQYFFRGAEDSPIRLTGSHLHIALIVAACVVVILLISARKYFDEHPKASRVLRVSMGSALIGMELIYVLWYIGAGTFTWQTGLPLYMCRMTAFLAGYALICDSQKIKTITLYWAFLALFALLFPALDPYHWPHITNVMFVVVHVLLLMTFVVFAVYDRSQFSWKDLQLALTATAAMLVISMPIDVYLHANYHFFTHSPVFARHMHALPFPLYAIAIIVLHLVMVTLVWGCGRFFSRYVPELSEHQALLAEQVARPNRAMRSYNRYQRTQRRLARREARRW